MQRSMTRWLACTGLALALSANPWSGPTAHADDDDDDVRQELTVTEVLVNFGTSDTIQITVHGADLDAAESVAVSLGEQGLLDVLSAAGSDIVALCPGSTCEDGDFLLTVLVEAASIGGDDDEDDDDNRSRLLAAAYDLTIGAVGPQGEKGDTGAQGPKGDKGDTGAQGPKGDKGDTGDTGDMGDMGDKGDKGDKGDQGDRGPQGIQGATGPRGPAGVSGWQLVSRDITCPPLLECEWNVFCPFGKRVLGGGFRNVSGGLLGANLLQSYPVGDDEWVVRAENREVFANRTFRASITCGFAS